MATTPFTDERKEERRPLVHTDSLDTDSEEGYPSPDSPLGSDDEPYTDLEFFTQGVVRFISLIVTLFAIVLLGWMAYCLFTGSGDPTDIDNTYLKNPPREPYARSPKHRPSRSERVTIWVDDSGHYSLYDALTDRHNPFAFPDVGTSSSFTLLSNYTSADDRLKTSKSKMSKINYDASIPDDRRYSVEDLEFAAMVPPGPKGHTVWKKGKEYTLAMYHQLRCLDVVRRTFVDRVPSKDGKPADYRRKRELELDVHSSAEAYSSADSETNPHKGMHHASSPSSSSSQSRPASSGDLKAEIAQRKKELRLKKRLATHCLNYLRQSLLCISDTRLESIRYSSPPHVVSLSGDYQCWDWERIADFADDEV